MNLLAFVLLALLQDPPIGGDPPGPTVERDPAELAPAAVRTLDPVAIELLDLVDVGGVRTNQLQGLGVVVGLRGSGDQAPATRRALANLVRRHGLSVAERDLESSNAALVVVTATLPPQPNPGQTIDVTVASAGDARSLFGGVLIQTPLTAADGQVYAVAQGSVSTGSYEARAQAASITQNHPSVGSIPRGAIVERGVPASVMAPDGTVELFLRKPDFVTADRIARAINTSFPGCARALNLGAVRLRVPEALRDDVVGFLASVSGQMVVPAQRAVVLINERTGTVVAGEKVRISTVAITQGDLTISIAESPVAVQPGPFSDGQTAVLPRSEIVVDEESRALMVLPRAASVAQLASALNRLGVRPRDLVSIFQALDRMGALHGRLELM